MILLWGDLYTISYERETLGLIELRNAVQTELAAPRSSVVGSHSNRLVLGAVPAMGSALAPSGDSSGAGPLRGNTEPTPQPITLCVGPGLTQNLEAGQTR